MKAGDIGFAMHHGNWLSKAIAWFMQSNWSHCFVICEVTDKRTYVVETSDYECTYGTIAKYLNDPSVDLEIWSPVDADDDLRQLVVASCETHVGQMYAYWQLFSLGVRRLLMRCGIKIKNFFTGNDVCDELVLEGAHLYIGLTNVSIKEVDTEELYQAIVRSSKFLNIYKK